jgi:hypothetical protein
LAGDPANFDALHLMGVLRHQRGRSAETLRFVAAAPEARRSDESLSFPKLRPRCEIILKLS